MTRKVLKCKPTIPCDTTQLLIKLGKIWGIPMLNKKLAIEVSHRLKKSLGRCIPTKGLIRLNPILLNTKHSAICEEVLCHEVAHYVVFLNNGPNCRPHGKEWKDLLMTAGFLPSTKLKSSILPKQTYAKKPKKLKIKYHHSCLICHSTWIYKRPMPNTICPHCKEVGVDSKLTINTNPYQ